MSDETVTTTKPEVWDDLRIEVIIGTLLRTGVILAAAVVLFRRRALPGAAWT